MKEIKKLLEERGDTEIKYLMEDAYEGSFNNYKEMADHLRNQSSDADHLKKEMERMGLDFAIDCDVVDYHTDEIRPESPVQVFYLSDHNNNYHLFVTPAN